MMSQLSLVVSYLYESSNQVLILKGEQDSRQQTTLTYHTLSSLPEIDS